MWILVLALYHRTYCIVKCFFSHIFKMFCILKKNVIMVFGKDLFLIIPAKGGRGGGERWLGGMD